MATKEENIEALSALTTKLHVSPTQTSLEVEDATDTIAVQTVEELHLDVFADSSMDNQPRNGNHHSSPITNLALEKSTLEPSYFTKVKANPIAKEKEDKTLEALTLPVNLVGDKNKKDLGEVNLGNHSHFLEHGAVHYTSGGYNPTQSQNPTITTSLDPTTSSTSVTPSPPMHKDPHPPTHTNPMKTTLHPHEKPNNTRTSIQHLETKFPLSFDTDLSIPDAPTPSKKCFSFKDKERKLDGKKLKAGSNDPERIETLIDENLPSPTTNSSNQDLPEAGPVARACLHQ
ncbi:hypothetical protein L6452_33085 [Arctium lappa]|uniref:Uncharacterized protein n=1 Tax=Arctium lappa TaxID=4217 RepID=A0ACB8Z6L5_ARCLA|nr:hypothetical protein L6452_33085 [Arctium lappa]